MSHCITLHIILLGHALINLDLHYLPARLGRQSSTSAPTVLALEAPMHTCLVFNMDAGDWNSGPHVCTTSTLTS